MLNADGAYEAMDVEDDVLMASRLGAAPKNTHQYVKRLLKKYGWEIFRVDEQVESANVARRTRLAANANAYHDDNSVSWMCHPHDDGITHYQGSNEIESINSTSHSTFCTHSHDTDEWCRCSITSVDAVWICR